MKIVEVAEKVVKRSSGSIVKTERESTTTFWMVKNGYVEVVKRSSRYCKTASKERSPFAALYKHRIQ